MHISTKSPMNAIRGVGLGEKTPSAANLVVIEEFGKSAEDALVRKTEGPTRSTYPIPTYKSYAKKKR